MSADPVQNAAHAGRDDDHAERCELTRLLYDLDWDYSQRSDAQDYLRWRLDQLGGPVSNAEAWGDDD